MRILMLFVDGVGIGVDDPAVNPMIQASLPALRSLFNGSLPTLQAPVLQTATSTALPLDATLGVDGLPQSGTGQTALFTGVNAPAFVGKHFGPYPYSTLRPVIEERNIFRKLLDRGKKVCFANAYPQRFFDYFKDRQNRLTVTTMSCSFCNMPLLQADALEEGRAISADITNAAWPRMGYANVPAITAQEAGRRLVSLAQDHDFTLFEYWRTDKAGHDQNMTEAVNVLELFDGLVEGILESMDSSDMLLFVTSDHGNVEDISTKVHTRNPVPAIMHGHRQSELAAMLHAHPDLTAVTPALLKLLN